MIKPSTKVYRQKIIKGFSVPAIIRNGNYFFVDIDVYEDGRVQCWNFEDFEQFIKDVQRGWVKAYIPDDNEISIHGLGSWTIRNGNWLFDKSTFINYIHDLIKELNPNLENIFKYSEKKINGITVEENGDGIIYKDLQETPDYFFPEKVDGESIDLYYKAGNIFYLVRVNVFGDNTLQLSRLENPIGLTIEELEKLINEKTILTEVPLNSQVYIYGLGNFIIKDMSHSANIQDKFLEIKDILRRLKDEPTIMEICIRAYENYLANPTVVNREKLKVAYENVPNYQKAYVGDMDVKDTEVRMIIYGEQEIENWSHYILAKELGEELPTITVPKPKDEQTTANKGIPKSMADSTHLNVRS